MQIPKILVRLSALSLLLEIQRSRVHAIALAGGRRAIGEYVSQVGIAGAAFHFRTRHAIAAVRALGYAAGAYRRVKAGPASTGFELGVRVEQWRATADAVIDSSFFVIPIFSGESGLGAALAGDIELFGRKLRAPLFF